MDYNATTPLEPEVIKTISEALQDAWGNPSSNYIAGEETLKLHQKARCWSQKCKARAALP